MVDMSQFIVARSDQLNADDLLDAPRTITITKVTAAPDAAEQPVSIHYEGGEGRPWKPCKTMRRIMVSVWGKDASKYAGRSMTLYRDPTVAFGGMQVGGIRVSHMSHIDGEKTVALMVTRGRKAPFKVLPLAGAPAAGSVTPAEDGAGKWAGAYIAKLATLDVAGLAAFEAEKAKKLDELATARPDLHANVTAALAARKAELAPSSDGFDDDLTNDAPAAAEAEGGTVAASDAEKSVAKTITDLKAAVDAAAVEAIVAETKPHMTFLDDALQIKLEIAIDEARNRVKPPEPVA